MKYKDIISKANKGEEVPYKFVHMFGGTVEGIGKVHNVICSDNDWRCAVRYNGKDYTPSKFSFDEVLEITNPMMSIPMLFYYKNWNAFLANNATKFDYSTDIPEGAIFIVSTETKWNNAILEMDKNDIAEIWITAFNSKLRSAYTIEVKCMNNKKQEGYVAHSMISGLVDENLSVDVEFMEHML